ncbi:MAG: hypothetical protein JWM91_1019 [Rhodospirillales bacterium]|nr:hypothetical protein [Rhodospirillales bacterium]
MGAEATGYLSEDDGRPESALAAVVGVGNVASGDEDEQIVATFADGAGELLAGFGVGGLAKQLGETAVEIGAVPCKGTILEVASPSTDGDGAQQQALEVGGETGIAFIDGVLGVAQQMGEADLALGAMAVLAAIAVGAPDLGRGALEKPVTTAAARLSVIRW